MKEGQGFCFDPKSGSTHYHAQLGLSDKGYVSRSFRLKIVPTAAVSRT